MAAGAWKTIRGFIAGIMLKRVFVLFAFLDQPEKGAQAEQPRYIDVDIDIDIDIDADVDTDADIGIDIETCTDTDIDIDIDLYRYFISIYSISTVCVAFGALNFCPAPRGSPRRLVCSGRRSGLDAGIPANRSSGALRFWLFL